MRNLLVAVRGDVAQWMGSQVPRRFNSDADLLSHPSAVPEVLAVARATFGDDNVHELTISPRCFDGLRAAVDIVFHAAAGRAHPA